MNKKESTKEKLLEAGAEIVHQKGFHHTGIQEILQSARVPKGSFYFYFKSKEDFGIQLVDHFGRRFLGMVGPILQDRRLSPMERIEGILDLFIRFFRDREYTGGCPVGNLAQEMGDLSPAFRERLEQSIRGMSRLFAGLLEEAREAGEAAADLDVERAGRLIVAGWHGALIHMKICKGPQPLEDHKRFVCEAFFKSREQTIDGRGREGSF